MTDIDGTVVAIQGRDVANVNPDDGYVLMWNAGNSQWEPRPIPVIYGGLRTDYFTSDDTWTCPDGVYNVLVIGCGGGGGGSGGNNGSFTFAGGGALQQTDYISVIPGLIYDIIVGAGGTGGISGGDGDPGLQTIISYSSSILFSARGGGCGGNDNKGSNCADLFAHVDGLTSLSFLAGTGGGTVSQMPNYGNPSYLGNYWGGINGTSSTSSYIGGPGGGAGPKGTGGNGGNGNNAGNGTNGQSAAVNTGAGGGAGGTGSGSSGSGGNGGSGYLRLVY